MVAVRVKTQPIQIYFKVEIPAITDRKMGHIRVPARGWPALTETHCITKHQK